ncbi:MAG: response regulator [Myxococcota bacterium]
MPAQAKVVLLVEDDAADVVLFRRAFPRVLSGARLVHHRLLADAVAWLETEPCDVAWVDLGLPDANRDEAITAMRAAVPDLPIVALTGDDREGTAERVLRSGAEDYVPKSEFDPRSLGRATRHAIERARMRVETRQHAERAESLERQAANNERLAAVGRIAAGVAHEINNPAAFISANLETSKRLLKRLEEKLGPFDESVATLRDCIDDSSEGISRISTIVKDLKTYSRVNSDEVELVDLDEIVDSACTMLSSHFRAGVRFRRTSDHPPAIAAVRVKLVQVVTNLVLNALHAVEDQPAGLRAIRVSVETEGGLAQISVSDSGRGVPDAIRDQVFEPFFTTKGGQGTGLGLALSSEIARAHGGSLELSSCVPGGTRVTLSLPLDTGLAPKVRRLPTVAATEHRPRVLLVDDEPMVRTALARLLSTTCDVVTAADGHEALALLRAAAEPFDTVLCDLSMPGMDGPEFHGRVREDFPGLTTRFVFLTGGAFTRRVREFLEDSSARVVHKPVRRRELVEAIQRVCCRDRVPRGPQATGDVHVAE